ncbi:MULTISPECIES: GNAT family N-acetyltransferase [Psychroflexus]|uniref:Ribosomal protein S18 acetylase RimI n=1 Tax=Psychroflexus halocasei TaxID=908615 RepID=A0A1H4CAL3_9FLAO|nr:MULTISPECIES: GNAT family N-acetyltransferase [Psychroflexus]PJX24010.1 GNAT family N-acetyltransferase [Psychroflexus sp. S27]SEA57475.1 Ribosomal protein S18 acetylase RimI [Psychroflexus halocasei]
MFKTDINIREAKLSDLDLLRKFEQEVIMYERPFAPNLKNDPIQYYDLEKLIHDKDSYLLVATLNDDIIGTGYSVIETSEPFKKPGKYAYLGFMFVKPQHRGKGVNGKIIDALIDINKANGITEVQLDVYAENQSALKAYKKKGFTEDLLKMRLNTEQ